MVRRRRGEPVWPFFAVLSALLFGVGAVVAVTGTLVTGSGEMGAGGTAFPDPPPEDGPLAGGAAGIPPGAPETPPPVPSPDDRVRVEVLNGGGVPGMAGAATDILRRQGFDVVYFGNEPSFGRDTSLVLARTPLEEAAEAVSEGLGIGAFGTEADSTRLVDVTVLLGADWGPPSPLRPDSTGVGVVEGSGDGTAPERPWRWENILRLIRGLR